MSRRGEGIYKRKDGRWEARYIHHYEDGKAKYRFLYGSTYTEVKAKRTSELGIPQSSGKPSITRKIDFKTLSEMWLSEIQIQVKESTYTRYERSIRVYLMPLLGEQKVSDFSAEKLKFITNELLCHGGVGKNPLSPKTVSDILCVLKSIIKYAKANGYSSLDNDVFSLPKRSNRHTEILSEEHRIALENRLWSSEDNVSLGIIITMYTGIRIGELCGLKWGDVDFDSGIVRINRTVERIADLSPDAVSKTKLVISEPKTENSRRIIPLPRFLLEHIEKFRCGRDVYVVTGTVTHTEPHQFYLRYKTFLRRAGVPEYTFHTLRHTFATRCVEHGFDTKSLAEILGHANVGTTLALYVHPTLEQKRKQMELLVPAE